jgi:hypothetical protein
MEDGRLQSDFGALLCMERSLNRTNIEPGEAIDLTDFDNQVSVAAFHGEGVRVVRYRWHGGLAVHIKAQSDVIDSHIGDTSACDKIFLNRVSINNIIRRLMPNPIDHENISNEHWSFYMNRFL